MALAIAEKQISFEGLRDDEKLVLGALSAANEWLDWATVERVVVDPSPARVGRRATGRRPSLPVSSINQALLARMLAAGLVLGKQGKIGCPDALRHTALE